NPLCPYPGRVMRGGSWGYNAQSCRIAHRGSFTPDYGYNSLGFRLSRSSK
ncbi:MAG: SUMF1/EgtB/PvdO family nonheme iron enzyme, partial [Candidatus Cloacimonetes bacterium]|nr:SUMF1/EgtB/PvdO family nonheme iron enzyme [Candidatus Cloacimonadota bacterium]